MAIADCCVIPQRIVLAIMTFFAIVNAYTMRVCLSVAIVQMTIAVNNTHSGHEICDKSGHALDLEFLSVQNEMDDDNLFTWSQALQGTILSSFFWGYAIAHLPGGILADKFSGKWTLGFGLLASSIFTILTPVAVTYGGATALIILRILVGLGQGTTFPAMTALLSSWIPLRERNMVGPFVLGGGQVGAILGTAISGLVLHHSDAWQPVFYLWGGLGLLWFIIFIFLCYDDPQSHPFIKDSEKDYLQESLKNLNRQVERAPIPWKSIFTSLPVFALINAQIGHDWGFYIMVTDLPKYMADVLLFSIRENGLYSSLPYLLMWIISVVSGFICAWLISKEIMGITMARKFWTILAAVGPAILLVGASYAGCNRAIVVTLFTLSMGLMGAWYTGMKLNPLDLSPNYSGTLMAITNGIGAVTGIIVPVLVGFMTPNASLDEWRLVFWIAFAVFVITSIVYGIWGSGEVQPWNDPKKMEADKKAQA